MRFLKLVFILIAVALIFSGCQTQTITPPVTEVAPPVTEIPEDAGKEEPFVLRIPYDYREGISPFTTSSKSNRFVCELVYRSMVNLTYDYRYELDLVKEIYTEDNITWYIYLEEGLTFPNGTEFTAYDLRYSLEEAMDEGSYFAQSLEVISSSKVIDATCFRIILKYADRYFPNLLTFPVISYKTVERPVYFPDRYSICDDGHHLVSNIDAAAQKIELVSAESPELLTYEMRMGRYDCIYVSDPGSTGSVYGGATLGMQSNRMVYLGFNSFYAFTYYSDFRRAVSAAIDYNFVVEDIYGHFASAPKRIYNPDFYEMEFVSKNSLDLMSSNLILDNMGFGKRDSEGFRTNTRGKRISLKLIVCNESQTKVELAHAISQMLYEVGLEVKVEELSYLSYMAALENNAYDLYIAEMRLGADFDLSKIITPYEYQAYGEEYINYGVPSSEKLYLSWLGFMNGSVTPSEFANTFQEVMPFAPICYTKGCAVFNRDLPFTLFGTSYDMFYNILDWNNE